MPTTTDGPVPTPDDPRDRPSRRGSSPAAARRRSAAPAGGRSGGGHDQRARRRPHPASGARIVVAGVSAAAVLGITAALGLSHATASTNTTNSTDGTPPDQVTSTGGPRGSDTSGLNIPRATPSFPAPTQAPDATTHGSR
jgi:hypothetical protein